jgi:photosystem II stability/assembly factor-like uncharacterized protein
MINLSSSALLPRIFLLALIFCTARSFQAQITAKFIDINPDSSSLDPSDADGASGGRVNGLGYAKNGSAYYAASEWGGIYKSTDAGKSWKHLDGHLPMVTWDVEVDPSNSNRIYATSFYDGRVNSLAGINVSTDGGTTWTHPATASSPPPPYTTLNRSQEPSAFGISIDPSNTNNVYVGTNTGLAISNNAGVTWRYVDPTPGDVADNIWDVVVHNGGIIDIVGDDGHYRSTDGGTTWTTGTTGPLLPAGRASIAVSPDESYVLFAVVGTSLFQTTNAGDSWSRMTNPRPQGRIPFVATNKRSGRNFDLWLGDVSLWRASCTTPATPAIGGANRAPSNTWSAGFTRSNGGHDDCADIVFDPTKSVNACPVLFASDGGVYYNTVVDSNCQTPLWSQPDTTPHGLWPFAMSGALRAGANPEDLYFGNQDNGSFGTTNAGTNKPSWTNRDCCDGFDFVSDNSRVLYTICCFRSAPANRLFRRNPGLGGGGSLPLVSNPPGNLRGFAFDDVIDQYAPNSYAAVTTTGLYVTTNGGATPIVWSAALGAATRPATLCNVKSSQNAGGVPVFYSLSSATSCDDRNPNPKQLWRFTGTNAAGTWQQVTMPGGVGGVGVYDVDPNNSNRIFISQLRPGNTPQMLLSEDGGTTWRNLPELDRLMTANGVFRYQSTVGPSNFTGFQGYPQPSFVAFDPLEPQLIVAGAADAGIFVSNDGGVCWTLITDPIAPNVSKIPHIPRPRFAYFSHLPDQGGKKIVHLYIGSQGKGVWRVELTLDGYPATKATATVSPPCPGGGCDGAISLTPTGGQPPYTYRWSNGQTTASISGLCSGDFTVTITDKFGCVDSTFTVPPAADNTPPVINCPANATLSCELPNGPAATGTATATDHCGLATVVHADTNIPGSCPQTFTINRRWTATDVNGLTSTCLQVLEIQDNTAPVLTAPPNITVSCDTTTVGAGMATALDNCDPGSTIGYTDQVLSGDCDWVCTIARTWEAADACRNTTQAVQTIEKNVLPLIQQALASGPLVLGVSQTTLTIEQSSAACILGWFPYSGTTPVALKAGRQTVGADCKPGTNPVDGSGRLTNPLMGEALKLSLLVRLSTNFGNKKLSTFPCTIAPIVMQALAPDPDINELLRVTNIAVGNIGLQPHLQELLEALVCINGTTNLCTVGP